MHFSASVLVAWPGWTAQQFVGDGPGDGATCCCVLISGVTAAGMS
jgi:hypothetical protein